jgi:hypothetical protein
MSGSKWAIAASCDNCCGNCSSNREGSDGCANSVDSLICASSAVGNLSLLALKRTFIIGLLSSLAACSTAGDILTVNDVKPWERGTLARDDMQLVNDSLDQRVDEHIYFSREASTGGVSVQGGGCGCN